MEVFKETEKEVIERDLKIEKKLAANEFEEKKIDLIYSLTADLEEKKKNIELERGQLELSGSHCNFLLSASLDTVEVKPINTRKLRRRPNDPMPVPEKCRKPSPDIFSSFAKNVYINFSLEEEEIMNDINIINKVSGKPLGKKLPTPVGPVDTVTVTDMKIDDGHLYYDKRWFHRNQPVFVECKETGKFTAVITAIGTQEIWIRKTSDSSKSKIYLSHLQKCKFILQQKQT